MIGAVKGRILAAASVTAVLLTTATAWAALSQEGAPYATGAEGTSTTCIGWFSAACLRRS